MIKNANLFTFISELFFEDNLDGFLTGLGPNKDAKIVGVHSRDKSTEKYFAKRPSEDAILVSVQIPASNYTKVLQKKIWASPRDAVELRPHKMNRLPVEHSNNKHLIEA